MHSTKFAGDRRDSSGDSKSLIVYPFYHGRVSGGGDTFSSSGTIDTIDNIHTNGRYIVVDGSCSGSGFLNGAILLVVYDTWTLSNEIQYFPFLNFVRLMSVWSHAPSKSVGLTIRHSIVVCDNCEICMIHVIFLSHLVFIATTVIIYSN